MEKLSFRLKGKDQNQRLDKFLAKVLPHFSRSYLQKLIKEGFVSLDGEIVRKSSLSLLGKKFILVRFPPPEKVELKPFPIKLDILYEDRTILVISKPAGLLTHPSPKESSKTLTNALLHYFGKKWFGLVHRLDKDTSGVMVIAKNKTSQGRLKAQFKKGKVAKTYLALVEGHLKPGEGIIDAPIGRDRKNPTKMSILPKGEGRQAQTYFRLKKYLANFSLVEVIPKTGRTHQIRVHFSSISHPLVGDKVYGSSQPKLKISRHLLHAEKLKFRHPKTKKMVEFRSPLPPDFLKLLKDLSH